MARPQEMRDKLRRCYIFDQMSLEIAAQQCDVSFSTARRWRKDAKDAGDDWDKVRSAHLLAGNGIEEVSRNILSGFLIQYQTTVEKLNSDDSMSAAERTRLMASLADAFSKTTHASRKVLPETNQLAIALEVLQLLGGFIQAKHPKHMAAFMDILEPFGEEIERKFG